MGRSSVCPSTSRSKSGIARASAPMRCRMGAAEGSSSALPEAKLMASLSVTMRSESRTATWTASARPSAATNSSRLRPAAASLSAAASRGRPASDGCSAAARGGSGCSSAGGQLGGSAAITTGEREGGVRSTAAEGRPPPESTTETSTKAKSWSTRSLKVISHPVWSSSSGAGSRPSARRRSGRVLRKPRDTARSLGGGRSHIPAQQTLDSRRVLPPVHEQDAVDDHLAAEALARQVGVELGGEGEDHDVGEHGAVERREHRDAEPGTDRREARVDQVPEGQHEADQRADQPEGREQPPERDEHVPRGLSLGSGPPCVGEEDVGQLVLVLALERERDALAHDRLGFHAHRRLQGGRTARATNAGPLLEPRLHLTP